MSDQLGQDACVSHVSYAIRNVRKARDRERSISTWQAHRLGLLVALLRFAPPRRTG